VHFTGKDVIYIVSLLVTLLSAWFKLKHDNERQNDKIKALNQRANDYYRECKEEFMNAKNGRVAIRRDFDSNITANNVVFSTRLDKVDKDLKDVNTNINKMNVNVTEVKAKIDIMINK
tara:strand:- start:486 stop:839 length:354 start_codon:yes stop_codon:yes gene_type:complete